MNYIIEYEVQYSRGLIELDNHDTIELFIAPHEDCVEVATRMIHAIYGDAAVVEIVGMQQKRPVGFWGGL